MKLVLSPAKTLDYDSKIPTQRTSEPQFLDEAERLNKVLKKKSVRSLAKLMDISRDLSELNYERNQEWSLPFTEDNARPAIYTFAGDVYRGFDAYSLPLDKLTFAQHSVRILSGLYGILRPLDLMQPYRLEMGTSIKVGRNKNLYDFWKKKITKALNDELKNDEVFVNLARHEYFKSIDKKNLKVPVIDIKFQEHKGDKYTTIAIYSKVARGAMARFIVENEIEDMDGIKAFDYEGYRFTEKLSSENELVFTR
ncbi:MAG: peroxide stress protein YaaA [Flavobacteriaceae bacterium]|nr:peroxide stress protein YaaA [Flavobacteriaceae bacterium]